MWSEYIGHTITHIPEKKHIASCLELINPMFLKFFQNHEGSLANMQWSGWRDHPMLSDITQIHVETYFDIANAVGGEAMLSNAVPTKCRTISPHESDSCVPTERV
jgi:hypothetical protein